MALLLDGLQVKILVGGNMVDAMSRVGEAMLRAGEAAGQARHGTIQLELKLPSLSRAMRGIHPHQLRHVLGEITRGKPGHPVLRVVDVLTSEVGLDAVTASRLAARIIRRAHADRVLDAQGNLRPASEWKRPRSARYPWPYPDRG